MQTDAAVSEGQAGEPQRQIVRLSLKNPAAATEAKVKIAAAGAPAYEESLGSLPSGTSTKDIRVPEISRPTEADRRVVCRERRHSRPT